MLEVLFKHQFRYIYLPSNSCKKKFGALDLALWPRPKSLFSLFCILFFLPRKIWKFQKTCFTSKKKIVQTLVVRHYAIGTRASGTIISRASSTDGFYARMGSMSSGWVVTEIRVSHWIERFVLILYIDRQSPIFSSVTKKLF